MISLARWFINFIIILKELTFAFVDFMYYFPIFYFKELHSLLFSFTLSLISSLSSSLRQKLGPLKLGSLLTYVFKLTNLAVNTVLAASHRFCLIYVFI